MATYRFRLEPVLRQRQMAEDLCQRNLAQVLRQRMILHSQLRSMQTTITESKQDLRDGLTGRVDMNRVGQFARYSGQVTHRAQAIVTKLAGIEKQIAEARQKLLEATRARKALQRLRDKQLRQWKLQQERRETAELDEVGVGQYSYHMAQAS